MCDILWNFAIHLWEFLVTNRKGIGATLLTIFIWRYIPHIVSKNAQRNNLFNENFDSTIKVTFLKPNSNNRKYWKYDVEVWDWGILKVYRSGWHRTYQLYKPEFWWWEWGRTTFENDLLKQNSPWNSIHYEFSTKYMTVKTAEFQEDIKIVYDWLYNDTFPARKSS